MRRRFSGDGRVRAAEWEEARAERADMVCRSRTLHRRAFVHSTCALMTARRFYSLARTQCLRLPSLAGHCSLQRLLPCLGSPLPLALSSEEHARSSNSQQRRHDCPGAQAHRPRAARPTLRLRRLARGRLLPDRARRGGGAAAAAPGRGQGGRGGGGCAALGGGGGDALGGARIVAVL